MENRKPEGRAVIKYKKTGQNDRESRKTAGKSFNRYQKPETSVIKNQKPAGRTINKIQKTGLRRRRTKPPRSGLTGLLQIVVSAQGEMQMNI